jgi:hypothetical protein
MLTFKTADWPQEKDIVENIEHDFEGQWGDRRQEIVFIAENLDRDALTQCFDNCLLTQVEMKRWERVMDSRRYSTEEKEDKLCRMFEGKF